MKNFSQNEFIQEMEILEMKDINGGLVIAPVAGPLVSLLVAHKLLENNIKE